MCQLTRIIKVIEDEEKDQGIKEAADFIVNGEIVAFPTETVYGLGANALNSEAVKKIFQAKGRPGDNPLIVHICNIEMLDYLVKDVTDSIQTLIRLFWPGPLTIIFKKKLEVPDITTAGLNTVAVRMPDNTIALKLIEYSGVPIAAPSANISGKPSPTTVEHVLKDINGRIPAILDGGRCNVGVESTVIDMTGDKPELLRPGAITLEQLVKAIGDINVNPCVYSSMVNDDKMKSPGMKYTHYSPDASMVIIYGDEHRVVEYINKKTDEYLSNKTKVGIMATDETEDFYKNGYIISMGSKYDLETIASNIFHIMRRMDDAGVKIIFAEAVGDKYMGLAVMNRMERAAGFNVIKL